MASSVPAAVRIELYEILYDDSTWAARQPGWLPLDNRANPRPDWREYDPMRRFLLSQPLDDQTFYGFFSPRFAQKTGLQPTQVRAFVEQQASQADVCTFSPFFDQIGFFLNAFEQGDAVHPGFRDQAQALLHELGMPVDLHGLTGTSQDTVFCNYWVARGYVWRDWLVLCEPIHALAQQPGHWQQVLDAPVRYERSAAPFKVFLMERMICLLLTQGAYRVRTAFLPVQTWADATLAGAVNDIHVLNALKLAERQHRTGLYRQLFLQKRDQLAQALLPLRKA